MTHVLRVPDKELVATAGIDALAFIRVSQFGIQLFFPIMFVVLIVFIPVHVSGNDLERQKSAYVSAGLDVANLRSGLNSKIMTTTAANLEDGAQVAIGSMADVAAEALPGGHVMGVHAILSPRVKLPGPQPTHLHCSFIELPVVVLAWPARHPQPWQAA